MEYDVANHTWCALPRTAGDVHDARTTVVPAGSEAECTVALHTPSLNCQLPLASGWLRAFPATVLAVVIVGALLDAAPAGKQASALNTSTGTAARRIDISVLL